MRCSGKAKMAGIIPKVKPRPVDKTGGLIDSLWMRTDFSALRAALFPLFILCISPSTLSGLAADTPLQLQRVAAGFRTPIYLTSRPGDSTHAFVLEQHSGRIRILNIKTGNMNTAPFFT